MGSIQSAIMRGLLRSSNLWNKPLSDIRKSMSEMTVKSKSKGLETRTNVVNGVACEEFLCTKSACDSVLVYFHGGGFCLGTYPATKEFVATLVRKFRINAYLPDYRIAPEDPYPAALDDAVVVYKGLLDKVKDAKKLIVMGDSSGCALAMSALLVLKESGIAMPKAVVCITPVFDLTGRGDYATRAKRDPFNLKDPLGIAKVYVGENNPASPGMSPLYGDLQGLPPMLICAGDYDVFRSDAVRFAQKAQEAGVDARLKVYAKMWHLFVMLSDFVPESKKALEEIASYMDEQAQ